MKMKTDEKWTYAFPGQHYYDNPVSCSKVGAIKLAYQQAPANRAKHAYVGRIVDCEVAFPLTAEQISDAYIHDFYGSEMVAEPIVLTLPQLVTKEMSSQIKATCDNAFKIWLKQNKLPAIYKKVIKVEKVYFHEEHLPMEKQLASGCNLASRDSDLNVEFWTVGNE